MHLRCPHCHNALELVDDRQFDEIECSSCGTQISLVGDETLSHQPAGAPRQVPRTIGPFQLIERLGMGAFGEVWRARDSRLDRDVAIKLPRKGQLDADESEQFLREARAAAQLKHPHIVSVHEVGRHDDLIYIVSDLVPGQTLSDWLADRQPTAREAAELCEQLALALDHAHEKGVIHRDLKPGNVMIDGEGRPHVMDFGLAKREAGEITMTVDGQVLGTPAYMSPEQARGDSHDVDRRCDIYSLGVVLFELLTGSRPFRGNSRMLLQQVLTEEAPSPRRLDRSVPRDLETICLKCLNKEPSRRYATAGELAEDLRRHLDGRPILSRPPSPLERVVRWCRRSPRRALAYGGLSALVVTASIALLARAAALERAESERGRRLAAVRSLARQAVAQTDDPRLLERGLEDAGLQLLEKIRDDYQSLAVDFPDDDVVAAERARVLGRLGQAYLRLGRATEAESHYRQALQLLRPLAESSDTTTDDLDDLRTTLIQLGGLLRRNADLPGAEAALREAIGVCQRLIERLPDDPHQRGSLGGIYITLGNVLSDKSSNAQAEQAYRRSLQIFSPLAERDPDNFLDPLATTRSNLAVLLRQTGRLESAQALHEETLADRRHLLTQRPDDPRLQNDLAASLHNLAILYLETSELDKASTLLGEAVEIRQKLISRHPLMPDYQSALNRVLRTLSRAYLLAGRVDEALRLQQSVVSDYQRLIDQHPLPAFREQLAQHWRTLGLLQLETGLVADAHRSLLESKTEATRLAEQNPDALAYQRLVAAACISLGDVRRSEAHPRAIDEYLQAVEILGNIQRADPESGAAVDLMIVRLVASDLREESTDRNEDRERAVETLLAIPPGSPQRQFAVRHLLHYLDEHARAMADVGDHAASLDVWKLVEPIESSSVRTRSSILRGLYLARAGDADAAVNAVGSPPDEVSAEGDFDLARLYCRASEADPDRSEIYAEAAVQALVRAERQGLFQNETYRARLDAEPDLNSLRRREDFESLRSGVLEHSRGRL